MKRRLLILTVFLLAGAVVNVVMAWGCWRGIGLGRVGRMMSREETRDIAEDLGLPSDHADFGTTDSGFGTRFDIIAVGFPDHRQGGARRMQAGWPTLALLGYRIYEPDKSSRLRWGFRVEGVKRPFPMLPIWPGFAVNTLFYATTLGLLVYGLLAVGRGVRVQRGLCPSCKYPMGESSVCSECGKPLPVRARATT